MIVYEAGDYVAHSGVLGMKWGIRRYQNPDGSLTELGKLRQRKEKSRQLEKARKAKAKKAQAKVDAEKKAARAKVKEEKKNAREEKKAQKYEAKKQKLLDSGTAADIAKHRKELTKKEIDDALARIETDRKLKEAVYREMNAGSDMRWARSDKFFERVGKVVGYANKGLDVVNTVKKIGDLLPKKEKVTRSMELARKALDNLGNMGYDEVMSTASMIGTVAKIESSSGKHKSKVKYDYDALLSMSRAGKANKDSGDKKEDDNDGDKKKEDKDK